MSVIQVNMDKAKEIKKDRIRAIRSPMLEELDVEFMRAVEVGDQEKQQEVVRKKQILRDITDHPSIVDAQNVEELKAADPLSQIS